MKGFARHIASETAKRVFVQAEVDESRLRSGCVLRDMSGLLVYWRTNRPDAELLERSKTKAQEKPFEPRLCPCCEEVHEGLDFGAFASTGACGPCSLFLSGKVDGVRARRRPTLAEVLAVDPNDLRKADVWVLRDHAVQALGGMT